VHPIRLIRARFVATSTTTDTRGSIGSDDTLLTVGPGGAASQPLVSATSEKSHVGDAATVSSSDGGGGSFCGCGLGLCGSNGRFVGSLRSVSVMLSVSASSVSGAIRSGIQRTRYASG
jgi:hypothetical protein